MGNSIFSDGEARLAGRRYPYCPLGRLDCGLTSREAYKTLVETVEPRAECVGSISCWISRNEDHFDLNRKIFRHLFEDRGDIRHVERALIRTTGISEEEERDIALSLFLELERDTRCISQNKFRFWQRRRDQPAPVCCPTVSLRRPVAFLRWPRGSRSVRPQQ